MYRQVCSARVTLVLLLVFLFAGSGLAAKDEKSLNKKCKSGVEVAMTFDSAKLVAFKPVEVTLKVVDAKGKPVADALIYCSFFMANYATGSNRPKFKPAGVDGLYSGMVFFSREGSWLGNLTINLPDGTFEEVTFEVDDVLPASS